jgi:PLP dependent protein
MTAEEQYRKIAANVAELAAGAGRDPGEVHVVAVSKSHPREAVDEVYLAGCRDFGENRMQEALPKMEGSPSDLRWHFIGNLQTKKVPKIIGRFHLIHSVDSPKLARKISDSGEREGVVSNILLEVNTSGEESKHGLSPEKWQAEFEGVIASPGIAVKGLMTMAPLTEDEGIIRGCFSRLREFRDSLQSSYSLALPHLSMGMTNDYPIAIEEGATLLRIGTAIFAWH